jgi:hypothetical protein
LNDLYNNSQYKNQDVAGEADFLLDGLSATDWQDNNFKIVTAAMDKNECEIKKKWDEMKEPVKQTRGPTFAEVWLSKMGILEDYAKYVTWKRVKEMHKGEIDVNKQFVISLSPSRFKPRWGGRYLYADGSYIQIVSVGNPSPVTPNRQGIPATPKLRLMDAIQQIDEELTNACLSITQTIIPLPPIEETQALEKARINNLLAMAIQESKEGNIFQIHDQIHDVVTETIRQYYKELYDGTLRMFKHSILVAVRGNSTTEVDNAMSLVTATFDKKGVSYEILQDGQVDAYHMMQATPYILERLLDNTTGYVVAYNCPVKSIKSPLPDFGTLVWENAMNGDLVFLDYTGGICGHNMIVGGSGRGKSTDQNKTDMRLLYEGWDIVHLLPKTDKRTNAVRICEELHGTHVDFADNCPNVWMPFYDNRRMDTSYSARQTVFNKTLSRGVETTGIIIGDSFTNQQRNWLTTIALDCYTDENIIDEKGNVKREKFKDWGNGLIWPGFQEIKNQVDLYLAPKLPNKEPNPKYIKDNAVRSVIQALKTGLQMITPNGTYKMLFNKKSINLDNKYTLLDITAFLDSPNIQTALVYTALCILQTKCELVPDGMEQPNVMISIDECASLMESAGLHIRFKKMLRELRSFNCHVSLSFTDLATTPRPMIEVIKQNVDYILLACNAKGYNLKPLVKEFALSPDDIRWLRTAGVGKFLLLYGDIHLKVIVKLTPSEERTLFNKIPGIPGMPQSVANVGYMPIPMTDNRVDWVWRDKGILCKHWLPGLQKRELPQISGYSHEQFTHPFMGGKKTIYIKKGLIKEDGNVKIPVLEELAKKQTVHIENQSKEHYLFVYALGGELSLMDALDVSYSDYGGKQRADLDVKLKAPTKQAPDRVIRIAFEVEMEGSHTVKELQDKRDYLLNLKLDGSPVYDFVIFTSDSNYWETFLADAVGAKHSAPRGKYLLEKIMNCIDPEYRAPDSVSKKRVRKQKTEIPPVSVPYSAEITPEITPIEPALTIREE